jgi:hypothetical protein
MFWFKSHLLALLTDFESFLAVMLTQRSMIAFAPAGQERSGESTFRESACANWSLPPLDRMRPERFQTEREAIAQDA